MKKNLALIGLVLALAAGGWFVLDQESVGPEAPAGGFLALENDRPSRAPSADQPHDSIPTEAAVRAPVRVETPASTQEPLVDAPSTTASPAAAVVTGPTILARVIDRSGAPIADRKLNLSPMPSPDPGEWFVPLYPAQSDPEGRLLVPLGKPLPRNSPYAFRIEDPDSGAFGWSHLDHFVGSTPVDIGDVVLELASETYPVLIDGWVRSESGEPVPGVFGSVVTASMLQFGGQASGKQIDTRDRWYGHLEFLPSGEFRLHGDPRAAQVRLEVGAPSFGKYLAQGLAVPTHGLEIILSQSAHWTGRFEFPTPGPGAWEYVVDVGVEGRLARATVSATGEFSLDAPADSDRLEVRLGTLGTPLLRLPIHRGTSEPYSLGSIDLTERICAFDFLLVDAEGNPWPRATVMASFQGGMQPLVTDELGRLRGAVGAALEWIDLVGGPTSRLRIDPRSPPDPVVLPRPK